MKRKVRRVLRVVMALLTVLVLFTFYNFLLSDIIDTEIAQTYPFLIYISVGVVLYWSVKLVVDSTRRE